jgi:Ca2+-binding EF-hand superfamily protein
MRSVLRADLKTAAQIFRAWDKNASYSISFSEFASALDGLGFSAGKQLTQAIFDELDNDASFTIGFAEFKVWLFSDDAVFEQSLAD